MSEDGDREYQEFEEELKYLPEPCRSFTFEVHAFVTERLNSEEMRNYYQHIRSCFRCREIYNEAMNDPLTLWCAQQRQECVIDETGILINKNYLTAEQSERIISNVLSKINNKPK